MVSLLKIPHRDLTQRLREVLLVQCLKDSSPLAKPSALSTFRGWNTKAWVYFLYRSSAASTICHYSWQKYYSKLRILSPSAQRISVQCFSIQLNPLHFKHSDEDFMSIPFPSDWTWMSFSIFLQLFPLCWSLKWLAGVCTSRHLFFRPFLRFRCLTLRTHTCISLTPLMTESDDITTSFIIEHKHMTCQTQDRSSNSFISSKQ